MLASASTMNFSVTLPAPRVRFAAAELPNYPEPLPVWPGSARSLCHHVPSVAYADCPACQAALDDYQDRAEAWSDLIFHLWVLSELIRAS